MQQDLLYQNHPKNQWFLPPLSLRALLMTQQQGLHVIAFHKPLSYKKTIFIQCFKTMEIKSKSAMP